MAQVFVHFSFNSARIEPNRSVIAFREKICMIDITPMIGRTIGAENFVRNRPAKLKAAITNVVGEIFWDNRQVLQIAAVKKNAAGTSDVTSALCARKLGSNAAMLSASKAPSTPKNSRAQRKIKRQSAAPKIDIIIRASPSTRSGSLPRS